MSAGIYKIELKSEKKTYIYIGQSINIEKRIKTHLLELNNNRKINPKFQNVYNKYKDTFKYNIIEIIEDFSKLNEAEIKWYSYYFGDENKKISALNITYAGGATYTSTHPLVRKKMSKSKKKYFSIIENREKLKKISRKYYNNPENREEILKRISLCRTPEAKINHRLAQQKRFSSKEEREHSSIIHGGADFYVFKNDQIIKEYINQREAARDLKLQFQKINSCLKGKRKSTGGYKFKYISEVNTASSGECPPA